MPKWFIFRLIHARADVCGLMIDQDAETAIHKFCQLYRVPTVGAVVLYSYPVVEVSYGR